MKKENRGRVFHYLAILIINIIGVYFARTNNKVKSWIGIAFSVYIVAILASFPLSAIKGKVGDFFADIAGGGRFYILFFFPALLAAFLK